MSKTLHRQVWNHDDADWELLNDSLSEVNWDSLRSCTTDEGAARLTETILLYGNKAIGKRTCKDFKSSHPWLTEEVLRSIKSKHDAEGTEEEKIRTEECSAKIMAAREAYIKRTKKELKAMKAKSKE